MTRRIIVLAAAALGVLGLAGCQQDAATTAKPSTAASAPASAAASAPASASAKPKTSGSAKPSASTKAAGGVPVICKLMSKAEVQTLTGESVTLMTDDGSAAGATTRYCQWQLSQGQMTVTVSLETRENFDIRNKQAVPAVGVGTTAYSLAGHLYVWQDGFDMDVYVSSESSDQANLSVARRTATQLLPRLEAAAK